jgi:hypothetical protein
MSRLRTPIAAGIAIACVILSLATNAAERRWTDVTGAHTLIADLVQVDGDRVRLRRGDGTVISVPIAKLSQNDRAYLASLPAIAPLEPALTLVRAGQAVSVIVTNGSPTESQALAAAELQDHLRVMSGATVPIVKENALQQSPQTLILVGPSNRAAKLDVNTKRLQPESFIVRTIDGTLLLLGEDRAGSNPRHGTLWAVYDFLQDQLGCRWIWPGEIGRVVPRKATVTVPELDIQETPTIKIRGFRAAAQEKHRISYEEEGLGELLEFGKIYEQISEDERVWLRRMRMGRSFKISYGHAFTDWWEKYADTHPDIFALQPNGRRGPLKSARPDFVKMCVSNPNLWELQLAPIKKYAQQGGRGLWVNACENDGSGGFCVCPRCQAWDVDPDLELESLPPVEDGSDVDTGGRQSELPDNLSDRYARWYNELARRVRAYDPDGRVITYAYSRYRSPPTKLERLEPNIWIGYVGFNAYPRPESYRKMSVDEWFGWSRRGATVFLRSNSLFYCGEGAPYVVTQQLAEDLQFQVKNGLRATDFDNLQGYWATTGPTYYVLARMLWDTDANAVQLLDEFYSSFGPLANPIEEYFNYWERFTVALGDNPDFFELKRPDRMRAYPTYYNEQVLADAQAILDKARALLPQATEEQKERFHNIELGLEHGRLLVEALRDGMTSNGPEGQALMAFRRKIANRNVINVYWTTSKEKRYRVFE